MSVQVVGAGPTGLVLACGLWAAGVPARVIDAADGPASTSRALGLQPRGMEVLDRVGALGELPERGVTVRSVIMNVGGREITRLRIGGVTPLVTRPGVMMSQAEIEAQRAQLAGTVDALAAKLDVKSQAQAKVADLKDRATTDSGSPRPGVLAGAVAGVVLLVAYAAWRRRS